MIDQIYQLLMDNIPDYKGKICVPISGGLDSRVLAGLISKKRKIDLSYHQYYIKYPAIQGTQIQNVSYARQIARRCGVERFEPICVNYEKESDLQAIRGLPFENQLRKSRMYTGIRILNERIKLKKYTIITAHGLDTLTGGNVNPITLISLHNHTFYDIKDIFKMDLYFSYIFNKTYGQFAKWDCPLWNKRLKEYFFSLPLRYRFHQYIYRKMINKYFPELAEIPREGMDVPMTIGETRYFYERIKHWLRN